MVRDMQGGCRQLGFDFSPRRTAGVISLEFLFVFPLVVGLLYSGLVYGLLFFSKVELQRVADAAVASVYYLDRRGLNPPGPDDENDGTDFGETVRLHAEAGLDEASSMLSNRLAVSASSCSAGKVDESPTGIVMLTCTLTATPAEGRSSFLPQLNLSFLGNFPPQPATLSAKAAVTF